MRVKEEEAQEICEMEKTRRSRDCVPACVREQPRISRRTFYWNHLGIHRGIHRMLNYSPEKQLLASFEDCQRRFRAPKLDALDVCASARIESLHRFGQPGSGRADL